MLILVRFVCEFFIFFSIGHLVFILFLYLAIFVYFLTVFSIFILAWSNLCFLLDKDLCVDVFETGSWLDRPAYFVNSPEKVAAGGFDVITTAESVLFGTTTASTGVESNERLPIRPFGVLILHVGIKGWI